MSGIELFIDDIDGRLHAAVVSKGTISDLYVDALDQDACWGSIYHGKVLKIDKRLDAAIIDLGNDVTGFLPAKHVYLPQTGEAADLSGIGDLLSPGQMILVQVKAEAKRGSLHEQHKMPRLTMLIYLIGQYLTHSPVARQVTISSHIENEDVLKFTARLKGKGGWLVQQNAERASEEQMLTEAQLLRKEWEQIQAVTETSGDRPRLVRAGPNAALRALNDYSAARFDHIHAANKHCFEIVTQWAARHEPTLAHSKRLRLFKPDKLGHRLFDIHDIYSELEVLEDQIVPLNGGGSIIIEPTHAVIMIDVNQGSGSGPSAVNQEAAAEVVRHIRLRNLSGAILIDFIGMHQKTERLRLVDTMERLVYGDHAAAEVHGFTRLGIIEITRKRRTATLAEKRKVYLHK
jgi:ribonuclease G